LPCNDGLEDGGVKFATWHLTAVCGALLGAAGSLFAQSPEMLPAPSPLSKSSIMSQPSGMNYDATTGDQASSNLIQSMPDSGVEGDVPCASPRVFPYSTSSWWRDGCWYGDFDFVVWNRLQPGEKIIGVDPQGAAIESNRRLNKHGNPLPLEPGGRGTLGYFLDRDIDNRDHSIEVTYLGFNNWEGTDSLIASTPQTLRAVDAPNFGGFNFSDTYTTSLRSSLQTIEVDYRIRNRPGRDRMIMGPDGLWSQQLTPGRTQSVFFGFRALSEEENFQWQSLRNGVSPDTFSGDMLIDTRNWLVGVQTGGDCLDVHDNWYWGIRGNAGIYCNFNSGSGLLVVVDPTTPEPTVNNHATDQQPAFYGELSFMLGYNLSDHMMVRASWDMALLAGIAQAPDQASFRTYLFDKSPFLSSGGQIFYTGLSLGCEVYW
jgi:hypothetical protein